jgi:hypothetical protein
MHSGLRTASRTVFCHTPHTHMNTQQALHVSEEASAWQSCDMEVNKDFRADFMKASRFLTMIERLCVS